MSGSASYLRLVPLVVVAAASLLALKAVGLITNGNFSLGGAVPALAQDRDALPPVPTSKGDRGNFAAGRADKPGNAPAKRSWMQEMFDYPEHTGAVETKPEDKNGAAAARPATPPPDAKPAPADAKAAPADPKAVPADAKAAPGDPKIMPADAKGPGAAPAASAGERAVLESLNQRRQELDARSRELDVRESLLAATEKKIEARLAEVKETEARINAAAEKKDGAEAGRFKGLVSMYENMKAKDAAKIFDRLELRILLEVAAQINPRRMSDILAQMSPEVAERLTTEIATRSGAVDKGPPAGDLPKIEGRPNGT
jgi:flagellar motility protein MotE (MotC chaperone)